MPDQDPERSGEARPSRPLDKAGGGAVSKKNFSALRVSVWSKNKGKPSPGSAAVYFFLDIRYIYFGRFDQEVLII